MCTCVLKGQAVLKLTVRQAGHEFVGILLLLGDWDPSYHTWLTALRRREAEGGSLRSQALGSTASLTWTPASCGCAFMACRAASAPPPSMMTRLFSGFRRARTPSAAQLCSQTCEWGTGS